MCLWGGDGEPLYVFVWGGAGGVREMSGKGAAILHVEGLGGNSTYGLYDE